VGDRGEIVGGGIAQIILWVVFFIIIAFGVYFLIKSLTG